MKFSAPFELFEKSVSIVNANPAANMLNDICQYVLLETTADNQGVSLTKSDLDVHINSSLDASVEQGGSTLVHGENLEKILKTYKALKKSDDCSVIITADANKLTIAFSDNKKYKPAVLSVRDTNDFAPIDTFENEVASCELPGALLKDFFAKSLVAVGKYESNTELNGVYFKYLGADIELVATNRQELSLIRTTPLSIRHEHGITNAFALIPRKTMETVTRILTGEELVEITISADMVRVKGSIDNVDFSVLNGTYSVDKAIDGQSVIPDRPANTISIPTAALKNALSHMEAIMEKKAVNKITIFADPTSPDSVTLSCKSPTGEIPGLPIEAKVEKGTATSSLTLNDQRLISLLKVIRSPNVIVSYDKPGKPCVFKGDSEPYFSMVSGSLIAEAITPPVKEPKKETKQEQITDFDDLTMVSDPDDLEAALNEIGSVEF